MTRSSRSAHPIAAVLAAALGIVLLAVLAHGPGLDNGFTNYDDEEYVTAHPFIPDGLTAENVQWAFESLEVANWHPITWLTYLADADMYGVQARGFHRTNLVLHAANAALLFFLLVAATGATWRSAAVAALFAVHPLHVESVAWVSERKDMLFMFFGLLAMRAYTAYARRPSVLRYLGVVLLFALGLMSKPMLVTLPFLFLLMDFWPLGRFKFASPGESGVGEPSSEAIRKQPGAVRSVPRRGAGFLIAEKIPLCCMSLASGVVTMIAQSEGGAVASLENKGVYLRLANALDSYVLYLKKLFVPVKLAVFYPFPESIPAWQPVLALVVLGWLVWGAWRLRSRCPALLFGLLWYLAALLPVIGLLQVGRQAMADRYTYLPFIGAYVAVVWGLTALSRRLRAPARRWVPGLALAVALAVLIPATRAQTGHWQDSGTLFAHAIEATDHCPESYMAAGYEYYESGNWQEALRIFRKGLEHAPGHKQSLHMISLALLQGRRYAEAEDYAGQVLEQDPGYTPAYNTLGVARFKQKDYKAAVRCFEQAARQDPDDEATAKNLKAARRAFKKWQHMQKLLGLSTDPQ